MPRRVNGQEEWQKNDITQQQPKPEREGWTSLPGTRSISHFSWHMNAGVNVFLGSDPLFWGCLVGRSGEETMTVAPLHTGTAERLGHITLSILWRYPATGQQEGHVNLKGAVAPWTLPYIAQEIRGTWFSCIHTTMYPCFPHQSQWILIYDPVFSS